jgi:hypothetical protein
MAMKILLKSLALPMLIAVYPILFLYGQNAPILNLGILPLPLLSAVLVAGLAFGIYYLFQRSVLTASLSSVVFILFFYLYGFIYRELVKLDKFPVQHYTLLPVVIILAGYAGYFIAKLRPGPAAAAQKILLFITAALLVFNLVIIIPGRSTKSRA